MADIYTLPDVIKAAIESHVAGLHVALPGIVEKYDAEKQVADVVIAVRAPMRTLAGDVSYLDFPTLPEVPIAWPSGGGYFAAFPLAKGDPVMLVFSEVATGEYLSNGSKSDPLDTRRHSLGYPVAIPGAARPEPKAIKDAPTTGVVIGKDDAETQIHVGATEIKLGKTATDFVALASLVKAELQALQTWAASHTHPAPGGATSAPTSPPSAIGEVKASVVKAK